MFDVYIYIVDIRYLLNLYHDFLINTMYVYMVGIFFLELIINAIIFTFIFWALTFLAKYTYSNKFYNYKLNFYECGFKNFSKKKVVYELNFILVVLFLLIYDGEFLILIPLSLNPTIITFEVAFAFLFFIIWLIITLIFDYAYHSLEWQIKGCALLHFLVIHLLNKKYDILTH